MMKIKTVMKGMAMGMAEVIPGVSGGTIAFITNIYERLINAIKKFDTTFLSMLSKGQFKAAFNYIDGMFLVYLIIGMMTGLLISLFTVSHLLEVYPPVVWSFFAGLILASIVYIYRQIDNWNISNILLTIMTSILTFYIVQLTPVSGSSNLLYVFICGSIAISALMLPGVSGSFVLLLLGMYTYIIGILKSLIQHFSMDKLLTMVVFGLGCLLGLAVFSRILSWTFRTYRTATLAALTGFMIGSLVKIWPWRHPQSWMIDSGAILSVDQGADLNAFSFHDKILTEVNVLPSQYVLGEPYLLASILSAIAGFTIVFILDRMGQKADPV